MAKILIIDDYDQARDLLREFFESQAFEVNVAKNGTEGLAICRTFQPDLVITDILMPDKEGLETIMEFRKQSDTLQIIAMSGCQKILDLDILHAAEKLGATRTFLKPIDLHLLLDTVNEILTHSPEPEELEMRTD